MEAPTISAECRSGRKPGTDEPTQKLRGQTDSGHIMEAPNITRATTVLHSDRKSGSDEPIMEKRKKSNENTFPDKTREGPHFQYMNPTQ